MDEIIHLPDTDSKLLEECEVTAFKASGKGGQHLNKTDSAVRIKHLPTGIVVASQKERSQYLNKIECVRKLRQRVELLNYRAPKRIPTRIPKSSKVERRASKQKQAEKKQFRSKNSYEQ